MEKTRLIDDRFLIGIRTPLTNSFSQNMRVITSFWKTFHQYLRRYQLSQGKDYVKYGITFREHGTLYYACAIPAKEQYPNEFEIFLLPRNTYFLYEHQGAMSKLPHTIQYLMKQHLPERKIDIKAINLIYYECYQAGFKFQNDASIITIGIPIQVEHHHEMLAIPAKTILQGNGLSSSPWFGMDYHMNLYKGCSHGCIYCDSRSACYQVEHFDIVRKKQNELSLLEMELRRKKRKGVIGIGAMSDTYHPLEKRERITRRALEFICHYGYGIGLDTKSDLILDDIDLIQKIAKQYPSIIKITITTANDTLCKLIEPHVVPSSRRFEVLEALHQANVFAGILLMPILPLINDTPENIRQIVYQAHLHHAKFIFPGFGVTLRQNQRSYFYYQLDHHFPGKRELYEKYYHNTYSCSSPRAKELYQILKEECERYGILYRMEDIIQAFKKDIPMQQMTLL